MIPASVTTALLGRPFVPATLLVAGGVILFLLACFGKKSSEPAGRLLGALGIIYLTIVLALRWHVSGHVPMASGFEMMMVIAWAACLLVALAGNRFSAFRPMGVLLAGFATLVAALGKSTPDAGPLSPSLASPFLAVHVSCMMFAYTLFGLLALCGAMGLIVRDAGVRRDLADRGLVVLYPALFLMTAGTIVGSFWANVSWGTYWNWDPKETWALVVIIVYSLPLHSRVFKFLQKPERFHLFCILAFLTVLFTYFGVNLLLGGMHSYAG